jgi:O-succinylbenzoic acid--CoA ligase
MMRADLLRLNGRSFTREQLLAAELPDNPAGFSGQLLSFLRRWLSNEPSFELTTSGSTGAPRPIIFRREQMVASARATNTRLGFTSGMAGLLCLPPTFVAGMMMCVRCLEAGATLIAVEPSTDPLRALYGSDVIDLAAMTPMQVHGVMTGAHPERLQQIRKLLIGGAAIDEELKKRVREITTECYATFGMTETLTHIALQPLNGPDASELYTVLPNIRLSLDSLGCLVVEAPYLDQPVITHDLVDLVSPSTFRWKGRHDLVINSGGIKLNPEVIEEQAASILREAGMHRRLLVGPMPDSRLGEAVWLWIEGPEAGINRGRLMNELKRGMDRYSVPKGISFISRFAETPTGKIARADTLLRAKKEGPADVRANT